MSAGRIPLIPTIVVLAAAATMVALGFWQLGRLEEKEALLARYAAAAENERELEGFPTAPRSEERYLYRRLTFECGRVLGWRSVAGRNAQDQAGYVHIAQCDEPNLFGFDDAPPYEVDVVTGWSRAPQHPDWTGGQVTGTITPGQENILRVVADPPLAGLEANKAPDPNDIPNNHLAYAVQWFFFALTALVIYALALRKRWRSEG